MSRAYDEYMEKQRQKEEDLLDVPERITEAQAAIDNLAAHHKESLATIVDLKKKLDDSNSIRSKLKDYLYGGIIGAILGAIVSGLMR